MEHIYRTVPLAVTANTIFNTHSILTFKYLTFVVYSFF